jgi:hypothetical protein
MQLSKQAINGVNVLKNFICNMTKAERCRHEEQG